MTSATPCWRRQMSSPSRWTSPAPWSTTAATHSPPTLEMRKTRKWEAVGKNEAADKQRTVLRNSSMTNDNSCFPFFATPTSTPSPRGDFFFNPEWLKTALLPKLRAPKIIAEMLLCWTPSYIFFFSPGNFQVSSFHFILFFSNLFCNPGVLGDVLSALCPEVCLLHSFWSVIPLTNVSVPIIGCWCSFIYFVLFKTNLTYNTEGFI